MPCQTPQTKAIRTMPFRSHKAKIVETQPMMKGSTASASYKPATLENGVVVQVPPFVTEGEEIIVDPSENRYIERAK